MKRREYKFFRYKWIEAIEMTRVHGFSQTVMVNVNSDDSAGVKVHGSELSRYQTSYRVYYPLSKCLLEPAYYFPLGAMVLRTYHWYFPRVHRIVGAVMNRVNSNDSLGDKAHGFGRTLADCVLCWTIRHHAIPNP